MGVWVSRATMSGRARVGGGRVGAYTVPLNVQCVSASSPLARYCYTPDLENYVCMNAMLRV